MIHVVTILVPIAALVVGAIDAAAEQPAPIDDLQIDGTLDTISNHELIDAIIAAAPTADLNEPAIEPVTVTAESGWAEAAKSAVGYPVTETISLDVAYEHEAIEDLTAHYIELGTAGVDYTSHKVLVRANWQFDLIP